MPVANIKQSLQAGVIAELKETWRQTMPAFEQQQKLLMRFLPYTTIRNASYPFKESIPFPRPWGYNGKRDYQTFRDRVLTIPIFPFELTVPWSKFDEEDDQLGDMKEHVQTAVKRYAQLPDVLLSEYFNGSASYNPELVTCYDGVSLFSATDGDGAARFQTTGGNILTGSGPTVSGLIHDLARVQARFLDFKDPAGKPIFNAADVDIKNFALIMPNALNEIAMKASESEYIRLDASNITSESNYVKGKFEFHLNPYLTDSSDYYVIVKHNYFKPFAYRSPKSVESVIADIYNSDRARENNEYALYTHVRSGLAPWVPFCTIKVNN